MGNGSYGPLAGGPNFGMHTSAFMNPNHQSGFENRYGQNEFSSRRNDSEDENEENDEDDENENDKPRSRSRSRSSTSSPTRQYSAKRQKCEPISPKPINAPNIPFLYNQLNQYQIPGQHYNPFAAHLTEHQKFFPFPGLVPNFPLNPFQTAENKTKTQSSKPKCSFDIESLIENKHEDTFRPENQTALSTSSSDLSSNSSCTNSPFKNSHTPDMSALLNAQTNTPGFQFSPEAFYLLVAKYQNLINPQQNQPHVETPKTFSPTSQVIKKEEVGDNQESETEETNENETSLEESKNITDEDEPREEADDKEVNVDDQDEHSFQKSDTTADEN